MSEPTVQQLRDWFTEANRTLETGFTQERDAITDLLGTGGLTTHARNILRTIRTELNTFIGRAQSLQEQLLL